MRLYLQRDISERFSRYEVYSESGAPEYTVKGKLTPSGETIRIWDKNGTPVCRVRRLGFNSLSAYSITVGAETVRLNIAVNGGIAAVRFRGISFSVRGNVLSGNYDIIDADNSVVCTVGRDFPKKNLTLTVSIEERKLFCIAAAVCIDSLTTDALPALQMT